MVFELNDKSLQPTLDEVSPVMVMFHADWAGPCHLVMPKFTEVAGRFGNQMDFVKFDLDGNPHMPHTYGIRAVPCFLVFVDGKPVNMIAGNVSADVLIEACEAVL